MKRLLTTTAIVLALGVPVQAQTGGDPVIVYQMETGSDFLASELMGMRVYATETEVGDDVTIPAGGQDAWDHIGDINNLVITNEGEVGAVILGVGGFLGLGEKDVAIDMGEIRFVPEEDNPENVFLVVNTTQEALEAATAFDRHGDTAMMDDAETETAETEAEMAATEETPSDTEVEQAEEASQTEDTAMAASDDAAATDDTMMAPERDMFVAPRIDRPGYMVADPVDLTSETLTGARVYDVNDEDIGEVSELILTDDGTIENVIIDVGGFLGIGEKRVAATYNELSILRSDDGGSFRVYIDATQESLDAQPTYEG
ncbi:MAG: PRC-barrel domain-containing protein [Roseitalea sp.]|jgi:sporulation protein YlmC with PRC-barrel domain|nr:PRC-barrel domain-containing protein [Roseitalea sp.]MBO6723454.1 PRC-barrel domain-containing protein [Roseitalea sp.]MBO6742482.1 PRC-barrel domain-containing protein [Roseitalea sp.]